MLNKLELMLAVEKAIAKGHEKDGEEMIYREDLEEEIRKLGGDNNDVKLGLAISMKKLMGIKVLNLKEIEEERLVN